MNPQAKRWILTGIWLSLLFIFFTGSILIVEHFSSRTFNETMRNAVTESLKNAQMDFPLPSEAITPWNAAPRSTLVWKAVSGKKASGYIFVAPVTGNSGPWPVIFAHDPATGSSYAGIVGRPDSVRVPERYGLTPRILEFWTARFDAVAESLEVKP